MESVRKLPLLFHNCYRNDIFKQSFVIIIIFTFFRCPAQSPIFCVFVLFVCSFSSVFSPLPPSSESKLHVFNFTPENLRPCAADQGQKMWLPSTDRPSEMALNRTFNEKYVKQKSSLTDTLKKRV